MGITNIPRKAVLARLTLAESARQLHMYVSLAGDRLEDLQRPGYFDALAPRVRRYDRIECVSDDDGLFAEFIVTESSSQGVRVVLMRAGAFNTVSDAGAPGAAIRRGPELHVEYRGPFLQWTVLRGDRIIKDKFPTESAANQCLNDLAKATAHSPEAA